MQNEFRHRVGHNKTLFVFSSLSFVTQFLNFFVPSSSKQNKPENGVFVLLRKHSQGYLICILQTFAYCLLLSGIKIPFEVGYSFSSVCIPNQSKGRPHTRSMFLHPSHIRREKTQLSKCAMGKSLAFLASNGDRALCKRSAKLYVMLKLF